MCKCYIIISYLAFSFVSLFAQDGISPKITLVSQVSLENKHIITNAIEKSEFDMNPGFILGLEFTFNNYQQDYKYGLGLNFQFNKSFVDHKGNYSFWPLYLFNRYDFVKTSDFSAGLQIDLGYNFMFADNYFFISSSTGKGSIFYSIGSIFEINNSFQTRINYSTNYGSVESGGSEYLIKNSFLSLGVGYTF
jgi:hypothetical protein